MHTHTCIYTYCNILELFSHTGINALFSGEFYQISFVPAAFDIILPPLVNYLIKLKPKIGFPPDPQVYIGTYSALGVEVRIFSNDNVLYLTNDEKTNTTMDYKDKNRMQASAVYL